MWLEIARPVTLLASILSLLVLVRTAFFGPDIEFSDRLYDTLCMFVIAAGFALLSGLTFPERDPLEHIPWYDRAFFAQYVKPTDPVQRLYRTFPVQVFCWTAGILLVLFLLNWYLQTHVVFLVRERHW
jgi:hypothetical protein